MWNKIRRWTEHFINVLILIVVGMVAGIYVGINSILMTSVINQLRLDTYLDVQTGFGIIMLVFLLGWTPYWLTKSIYDK